MCLKYLLFAVTTIYQGPPAERMSCIVGDLDNDGVPEFIVSTRHPDQLHWFGRTGSGAWQPHLIDDTFPSISVGGALVDLTGSGRLDLIAATSDRGSCVYWWECPADPAQRWVRRDAFRLPANRTHDLLLADIDGDGRQELYCLESGRRDAVLEYHCPERSLRHSGSQQWRPARRHRRGRAGIGGRRRRRRRLELIAGCSWYRLLQERRVGTARCTPATMAACGSLPPISTATGDRR